MSTGDAGTVVEVGEPPKRFYEALGRLVYQFGQLDGTLEELIGWLIGTESHNLLGRLTQGETTDWLRAKVEIVLAERRPGLFTGEEIQALRQYIFQPRNLISKRNRFVHSSWYYAINFDEMRGARPRRHSDFEEFGVPIDEIESTANATKEIDDGICKIFDRLDELRRRGYS